MNQKHKTVIDLIKKYKADGFISTSLITNQWLLKSGPADFCLILAKHNQIHVFADERDITTLEKYNPDVKPHLYKNINSWLDFCKSQKLKTTLFESNTTTYDQYVTFIKPVKTKLIPFNADDLRIIKTKEELIKLQKAADIICGAIEHLKKWIKVGKTEIEAAKELHRYITSHGAIELSFPTIVSFGKNSAHIHGTPTNYKLKRNDVILVDAGCVYDGYCSDITRVWTIGKLSTKLANMYDIVLKANKLGIKNAKANVIGSKLDGICRNFIKQNWNGYDIPHGTGHGLGLLIHENPRVNKIYHKPLPINSVVTIEPGIYDPAIGGVRIEDSIVITKNGCKVLTNKSPK